MQNIVQNDINNHSKPSNPFLAADFSRYSSHAKIFCYGRANKFYKKLDFYVFTWIYSSIKIYSTIVKKEFAYC